MSKLTEAVALSGALDPDMLREICKWKLPIEVPEGEPYASPEEAVSAIEAALEGKEQVEVRATDLDVLKQYMKTQHRGRLHIVTPHESGTFDVMMGITPMGDYIIPWKSDSLTEHLTNGESYIIDGRNRVHLSDVRDLYFGEQKAFILCQPGRTAP